MTGKANRTTLGAAFAAAVAVIVAGVCAWASAQDKAPAPAAAPVAGALATPAAQAPAANASHPLAAAVLAPRTQSAPASARATVKPLDKPLWKDLSRPQQVALEPLMAEWDRMDLIRKQKWLDIANRYAAMKPDEQQRVHERMRDWIKLTPDERRLARENYARVKKIDPTGKTAQWEQYQQLPEEQKKKLAADAATKKQVANLPSKPQTSVKTVAPIKAAVPAACPPGSVKNAAGALPACIAAPAVTPAAVAPAPAAPAAAAPVTAPAAAASATVTPPAAAVPASNAK